MRCDAMQTTRTGRDTERKDRKIVNGRVVVQERKTTMKESSRGTKNDPSSSRDEDAAGAGGAGGFISSHFLDRDRIATGGGGSAADAVAYSGLPNYR